MYKNIKINYYLLNILNNKFIFFGIINNIINYKFNDYKYLSCVINICENNHENNHENNNYITIIYTKIKKNHIYNGYIYNIIDNKRQN